MILEVAILEIKQGQSMAFEKDFALAAGIISSVDGYIKHDLRKCMQVDEKYILLVEWKSLEAHTSNFRKSEKYQEWKSLLHHYYEPFPEVEHYKAVVG